MSELTNYFFTCQILDNKVINKAKGVRHTQSYDGARYQCTNSTKHRDGHEVNKKLLLFHLKPETNCREQIHYKITTAIYHRQDEIQKMNKNQFSDCRIRILEGENSMILIFFCMA